MESIYIPQLAKAPARTQVIELEEFLEDLDTLTPVRGRLQVIHQGNYLEVSAQAETIITLTCDRCLQQYNWRLKINPSELIWLDATATQPDTGPQERETALEDLVETLHPQGHFHPDTWLYEQLCLEIPYRKICQRDCGGISLDSELPTESSQSATDSRWSVLESLKNQLPR